MEYAVIIPTYNERHNIPLLVERLKKALSGLRWEVIFVDDDSPDGTADAVLEQAQLHSNVRLVQRIGRRGLASACIEGMLVTQARFLAVMDGDLQHDESVLPQMFARLRGDALDLVIATRNAEGGSMGNFSPLRASLSRLGQRVSTAICRARLTDAMSGFFALRREFLNEVVHDLQGSGFKILVDMLSAAKRPVRLAEIGYTFGERKHGDSKLDVAVGMEYVAMVLNRLLGGLLPASLVLYLLAGTTSLTAFLSSFLVLKDIFHVGIVDADAFSTVLALALAFAFNNLFIFRDRRLKGIRLLSGAVTYSAISSFGAWTSLVLTSALVQNGTRCIVASTCGTLIATAWTLSVSSQFTWRTRRAAGTAHPYPRLAEIVR